MVFEVFHDFQVWEIQMPKCEYGAGLVHPKAFGLCSLGGRSRPIASPLIDIKVGGRCAA